MKRTIRIAILAAPSLSAATALGQSLDYGAMEQLFGEPVTTSVTGSPQRESEVAATMQIITADDIRRSGARDLPGVLRHAAGSNILQTSFDHADLAVRGYNQSFSPRLLVLVDGRQVYADYYGFTPWSTIPVELEAIRQIEVVKGPNSALFGFNAVGGVINIVTYDARYDSRNEAAVRVGTQGLAQASAVSTWKIGELAGLRLSAGRRSNDDYSTPLGPLDLGARRGNERSALTMGTDVGLSERVSLEVEATYSEARHSELGPVYALGYAEYETHSFKAGISAETAVGLIEGGVYRNDMRSKIYNGPSPVVFLNFDNDVTVAQLKSVTKLGGDHTLRLLAEARDNQLPTTPVVGADVFYDIRAFGAAWEWSLQSNLALTTAARWDRWTLGRKGVIPPGFGLSNEDWAVSRTEPSFNLGLLWDLQEGSSLRFLLGRGVQLPSLMNLGGLLLPAGPFTYVGGVPDLEPTEVMNFELTWDIALDAIGGAARLTAFRGGTHAVAAALGGSRIAAGLVGTPVNVGNSHTKGGEASVEGQIGDRWRWGAAYTHQEIDDDFTLPVRLTFVDFEGTTPRDILLGFGGWSHGSWEIDGFARYQSSSDAIIADPSGVTAAMLVPIDAYIAVDARIAYSINERMTISVSGQNLNRSEQRQTGAPLVERHVLASWSVEF